MNEKPARYSPSAVVLLLLAVATAAKLTWAFNSIGSMDAIIFFNFGAYLQHHTLRQIYEGWSAFNHTPLTGFAIRHLYAACRGNGEDFSIVLRGFSIFSDIGLVLGLLYVRKVTGRPPWWALGAFAVSPVSIIISGFHGNLDPVMVMFLFFAAIAVLRNQPALSGLLLALSMNVKIVPILLVPAFFFFWLARGRRPVAVFTLVFAGGMLLGSALPLWECPRAFIAHVYGYGSFWGCWGVTYWLRMTGLPDFHQASFFGLSAAQERVMLALKVIVIGSTLALAWRRRKVLPVDFFSTLGAAWVLIFVFAPGVFAQYFVWFAPFILILAPAWWVALTLGSVVVMVAYYHPASNYSFPWVLARPFDGLLDLWTPWSNVPWAIFIACLIFQGRKWWRLPAAEPASAAPLTPLSGAEEPLPA